MTATPLVAIVILNWNGKRYLEEFLPSVLSSTYSNYKVVVADNASSDDSVNFLRDKYPEIEVIQLEKNHGFAKGYNDALKQVNADIYVLLNSDVEVVPGWLEPLVSIIAGDDSIAACQPKMLSYQNKGLFEYSGASGGWLDLYGYPFARGRVFDVCEADKGQYNKAEEIFWASGAALVIKRKVFWEVGGFDEYFFAHQEEIDLCWRIHLAGYKIVSCPQSIVYHVGGGTLPKGNSLKTFLNFRNNLIMLSKNLPLSEKWFKLPFRLVLDQVSATKGLFTGDGGYFISIIKAHFAYFKWLVFEKKPSRIFKRKSLKTIKGVYKGNVVWLYFVRKKRKFSEIVQNRY